MIEYTLFGRPRAWQRAGSRAGRRFTPKAVLDEQRRHAAAAIAATPMVWRMDVERTVELEFVFTGGNIGDVDNYAKLVMDALNGVAYDDDKQVTRLVASKRRGDEACTVVRIF